MADLQEFLCKVENTDIPKEATLKSAVALEHPITCNGEYVSKDLKKARKLPTLSLYNHYE
jgi:hypothetical protein